MRNRRGSEHLTESCRFSGERYDADQRVPALPLAARPISGRFGAWLAVKRVKRSWLSNAMAMTHYWGIVNASGHQPWHSHDRYNERHRTLPDSPR